MKNYLNHGEWKIRKINIDDLTEKEKGYLIGMVNGDGYYYYEPHFRHYTIEFYSSVETLGSSKS